MSRAAHADDRPARAGRRLFISGLGIGQICSWGSLYYSFPLIAEAMRSDLGWSKPDLYGAATIGLLFSGLAAYPVGSAIDQGHGRTITVGASVVAGILLIAWSQVESVVVLYILLAGLGCLQAAVLTEVAFAVVSRRFGAANARGGIVGLTLWAGFASTVFIPLIQFLLDHFGWRETLIVLGSINIVLCGGLYAAVIDPAADASPQAVDPPGSRPMAGARAVGWALKSPIFWALAIALTAYWAVFSAFIFHAYPLLLERGFDTAAVVFAMAVIGPAQGQRAVSTAVTLFLRLDLRRGAAGRPFVCDDLLQALDAIVGESRDSIFTDPVDAQAAIVGEHVHLEFPQPFLILAEHLGDVVDGKDV
jgi:Major Facilitator Superfamily